MYITINYYKYYVYAQLYLLYQPNVLFTRISHFIFRKTITRNGKLITSKKMLYERLIR